jgi:hypothetical protein
LIFWGRRRQASFPNHLTEPSERGKEFDIVSRCGGVFSIGRYGPSNRVIDLLVKAYVIKDDPKFDVLSYMVHSKGSIQFAGKVMSTSEFYIQTIHTALQL